jgi:transcriptional regulator of acetoin/glycerol metabolism
MSSSLVAKCDTAVEQVSQNATQETTMTSEFRHQALTQARRLFSEQGVVPKGMIAEPILRSWRRCAEQGFDMHGMRRQEPLTRAELMVLRERHEHLRRACRSALTMLRREADRTDSLVILTDASGASRVALMPGAPWNESAAGTNAIGTALVEQRPIAVHGQEHFFAPNRILTCAAIPIADPQGRTVGVLDLSGDAVHDHRHAMGLVSLAVAQIERNMFTETFAGCSLLRLHPGAAWLGTPEEGVLALRDNVLVGADRNARTLLSLDDAALGVFRYADIFEAGHFGERNDVVRLRTHGGATVYATWLRPTVQSLEPSARIAPPEPSAIPANIAPEPVYDSATLTDLARAVHLSDGGVAILLLGETGTGKELFARQLHARSRRANGPFVAVNCAALPESLIESELFGYEEGAFTGARKQGSRGLLRQAHGGVLFLDEIGDMPLGLQARLLRVLQTREITPLGGGRTVPIDFALVCATHRNLSPQAADAAVRADLYFRIAEYTVRLSPLREHPDRRAVIRALWQAESHSPQLDGVIEDVLAGYDWPGNYRQLAAVLRTLRVLASSSGMVRMNMLPEEVLASGAGQAGPPDHADPAPFSDAVHRPDINRKGENLRAMTAAAMRATLAACGGNMSRAARELGVHRSTLYRHIGSTAGKPGA